MKKSLPHIIIFLGVTIFAVGVTWLFLLRYGVGDVYPAYSTLRSDPLGTMAFYESLEKIPTLTVRRDYSTANRLPEESDTTYLHLATTPYDWKYVEKELAQDIDGFLARGGRLAITFYPQAEIPFYDRDSTNDTDHVEPDMKDPKANVVEENKNGTNGPPSKDDPGPKAKKRKKKKQQDAFDEYFVSLKEKYGVEIAMDPLQQGPVPIYEPVKVRNRTDLPLPQTLDWHSGLVFTNLDKSWHTIYARGRNAVVIERSFGRGTLVMATDSYFLSNEALWKDRQAPLLAWLVGPHRHIVFDEAHLGIAEASGVAVLMRQYRLHGLVGALLVLAALFIWKNSQSLIPPRPDEQRQSLITGKDAQAGFVNLLRRNVLPRDLLNTCFTEWKKTAPQNNQHDVARLAEVQKTVEAENALGARTRNPVEAYQRISQLLKKTHGLKPTAVPNPTLKS